MSSPSRSLDVEAAIAGLVERTSAARLGLPVVALGWATVDTDRAASELAEHGPFRPAPGDALLGASCVVGRSRAPRLAILEPTTEGRLAATLARHDEGPVAVWLAGPDPAGPQPTAGPGGIAWSASADGPFGPERLLLDGARHGPHVFVLEAPPSTIER